MMFWKFQTQRAEPTEPAAAPVFVPATAPVAPPVAATPPQPAPTPVAPAAVVPAPVAPPAAAEESVPTFPLAPSAPTAPQPPAGYSQAAERTMRFLGEALQLPAWVLFKNLNGTLTAVTGIGDYLRYIPQHELTIGRLSDLPTVNLLGAAPPTNAYAGADRRQGNIDPATIAPYGVPLLDADGNLFGILCAFGERAASQRVTQLRPLLDFAAAMLGALVRTELTLEEATRRTERAQADALVDPLTGLHNRRAWDQLLATEDQRCNRHGYDAVIFVIDLDGLKAVNDRFGHEKGDELIKNAAQALERCVRRTDVVARVGGDEFSILAVKCDASAAARIREHIESTLQRANAPATVGFSVRSEAGDLFEAWRQADGAMYHRKRGNSRHGQRATDEHVIATAPEPAPPPTSQPSPTPAPTPQPPPEPAVIPKADREATAAEGPTESKAAPAETSVVTQILERVLPALVSGIQKTTPAAAPPPPPPPTPVFAAPQPPQVATRPLIVAGEAEIPTYTPPPQPPAPPAQQLAPPQPVAPPPPEEPRTPAPPIAEATPPPETAPANEPVQNAASQPSEDLIDIVSRLSRLSDADRRLLDVFFKGSR